MFKNVPGETQGKSVDLIVVATGKGDQLGDEFFQPSGALGKSDGSSGEQVGLGNQARASLAQSKLDASILSYEGKDFVRTETTLMKDGQSAANTKLDPDSPAYKALVEKHSYTGPATVFGKDYQANYAPLTSEDGKLTGALFVGIPK